MPTNFPDSPSVGDRYSTSGRRYKYAGSSVWTADDSVALPRQRLINPGMRISQEWGGPNVSGYVAAYGYYPADQWEVQYNITGTTIAFSLVATDTSLPFYPCQYIQLTSAGGAATVAATEHAQIRQWIEGQRICDFLWGTANAKSIIIRFWMRTTFAGVYSLKVSNGTYTRSYVTPITYYTGNTWQQIQVSIPGDTTGTWAIDNTAGMFICFTSRIGTTYQTTANTWTAGDFYGVTGSANFCMAGPADFAIAQVEMYLDPQNSGVAPRFVLQPEADELRLCQRYWYRCYCARGVVSTSTTRVQEATARHPVDMRIDVPAISIVGTVNVYDQAVATNMAIFANYSGVDQCEFDANTGAAMVGGRPAQMYLTGDGNYIAVNARM